MELPEFQILVHDHFPVEIVCLFLEDYFYIIALYQYVHGNNSLFASCLVLSESFTTKHSEPYQRQIER